MAQQLRALSVADRLLSIADRLDEETLHSINKANRLRASILAAAFSGDLVPQDPTDESASVLIQRIAAERAVSNGDKLRPGRKPRAPREKVTA